MWWSRPPLHADMWAPRQLLRSSWSLKLNLGLHDGDRGVRQLRPSAGKQVLELHPVEARGRERGCPENRFVCTCLCHDANPINSAFRETREDGLWLLKRCSLRGKLS